MFDKKFACSFLKEESRRRKETTTGVELKTNMLLLSSRFKNFGSSRNSLNQTLRPNIRPNSDDSLCHVIDSYNILGST